MNPTPRQGEFNFDPQGESKTPSRAEEAKAVAKKTAELLETAPKTRPPVEPKGPSEARRDQTSPVLNHLQDKINADGMKKARQALDQARAQGLEESD